MRNVLVCIAWPYAHGVPHLGNFIQLISGDILTRYYKLTGANVLCVTGSDTHGARMELQAYKEGITPKELVMRTHNKILNLLKKYKIDIYYTWTESKTHKEFVQEIYKKIYENGFIITKKEKKPYCENCKKFLADRFIKGTCPHCGFKEALGNQCDKCGRMLEPEELINPVCEQCGKSNIIIKETKHWYLDLPKLEKDIREYVDSHPEWDELVKEYTYRLLNKGLKPRPITRDVKWGIPAPFPGSEGKTIYVWAEAVLGYVSATIEWAKKKKDDWKKFWFKKCNHVYVHGKDNIPFHTIILPGLLIASKEGYNLPTQISATFFLNWEGGQKFSKSRGIGLWADKAIELIDNPDVWRFYLAYIRPEKRDREFSWNEFIKTINMTLVGSIGNLYNRCLKFTKNGLPKGKLENKIKNKIESCFKKAGEFFENGYISEALKEIIKLSDFGNEYFQKNEPWKNKDKMPDIVYNTFQILVALTSLLYPFVPVAMEKARKMLGINLKWEFQEVKNPKLKKIEILFKKIEKPKEEEYIEYEEFKKIKLMTAKILSVEPLSKKLYKLEVLADKKRTIVAGLRNYYAPKELIGKTIIIVANLEPKKLAGQISEGMLLAAEKDGKISILITEKDMPPGAEIF